MRPWLPFIFITLLAPLLHAAEPGSAQWRAGDAGAAATSQPAGASQRLDWVALCTPVSDGIPDDPAAPAPKLPTPGPAAVPGVLFQPTSLIGDRLTALNVDLDLPLPRSSSQEVIDWTNNIGGAAILMNADDNLNKVDELQNLCAFNAFANGRWHPACFFGGGWDQALGRGIRIFIVGSSAGSTAAAPSHPVTYVLSPGNNPDDLARAIRSGQMTVSTNNTVRLTMTADGRPPGAVLTPKDSVDITLDLAATEPIDEIRLIGNQIILGVDQARILKTIPVGKNNSTQTITLKIDGSTHYIRAVALAAGEMKALTNPVFFGDTPPARDMDIIESVSLLLADLDWNNEPLVRKVIERLLSDRQVGPAAAIALTRKFNGRPCPIAQTLLHSPNYNTQVLAAYVLWKVDGSKTLPELFTQLNTDNSTLRLFAARLLAREAGPEQQAMAEQAAADMSRLVRTCGIAALGRLDNPKASLIILRRTLFDAEPSVRQLAENCLLRMLNVPQDSQAEFVVAFRRGKLQAPLLEQIASPDLRPLVEQAAAVRIPQAEAELAMASATPQTAGTAKFPTLIARRISKPAVNGRANPADWAAAKPLHFVLADEKPPTEPTEVKALADDQNLYLLFTCHEEKPGEIVAAQQKRDSDVWLDDSIDISILRSGKRTDTTPSFLRFCVNAKGVQFESLSDIRSWDLDWKSTALIEKDKWTLEIALPRQNLQLAENMWLLNFTRHRLAPPGEESFLAPQGLTPEGLAELRFETKQEK